METQAVIHRFRDMGADLKIVEEKKPDLASLVDQAKVSIRTRTRWGTAPNRMPSQKELKRHFESQLRPRFNINIVGGRFEIKATNDAKMVVLDLDKAGRHLLLQANGNKFLCGHDERQWFTCAVPGSPKNVFDAKEALKPQAVKDIERGVSKSKVQKRHVRINGGKRHRQGEFFFTPRPELHFENERLNTILRKERIGNSGHPHIADELVRPRGKEVLILHGRVISQKEFDALEDRDRKMVRRQALVDVCYVRGKVRHEEHATLELGRVWHAVTRNTEKSADGSVSVLFID